jgi:hypothetical protein
MISPNDTLIFINILTQPWIVAFYIEHTYKRGLTNLPNNGWDEKTSSTDANFLGRCRAAEYLL